MDNSSATARYRSCATPGIPVWIDYKAAIAHNKVMVIDGETVVTGSFNFTKAAQEKNAENISIIHDRELARKYLDNWQSRLSQSMLYEK